MTVDIKEKLNKELPIFRSELTPNHQNHENENKTNNTNNEEENKNREMVNIDSALHILHNIEESAHQTENNGMVQISPKLFELMHILCSNHDKQSQKIKDLNDKIADLESEIFNLKLSNNNNKLNNKPTKEDVVANVVSSNLKEIIVSDKNTVKTPKQINSVFEQQFDNFCPVWFIYYHYIIYIIK